VIAYDPYPSPVAASYNITYLPLNDVLSASDILSLHCPLLASNYHMLNEETLGRTKRGVVIVNTSRGGLMDTKALIKFLKSGHIGALGLDGESGKERKGREDFLEKG
jgi:D-lactate dehydrogenase